MKKIILQISDEDSVIASIKIMDRKIPESKKDLPEYVLFYNQVTTCIQDFRSQFEKLSNKGTTLHLKKEVKFSDISVVIILDYPKKATFVDWVKKIVGV